MKKTRKFVNERLDIYMAGKKAAENNEPRFAPYITELSRLWFAGYDSVKLVVKKP
jgi:hypothetical protein